MLDYLRPMLEPIAVDEFRFTRAWLRAEAARIASPQSPAYQLGRQLNLPPSYLLIHRVTLGSIGVLCQLEAKAPYRAILERWLPGFASGRRPRRQAAARDGRRAHGQHGQAGRARSVRARVCGTFVLASAQLAGVPAARAASRSAGRIGAPQGCRARPEAGAFGLGTTLR